METAKDKSPDRDVPASARGEVSLADSVLPSLRQNRGLPQTPEQEWAAEKSKIAVLKAMRYPNDITELKQLVENGAPINWEYGGALQFAVNIANPTVIRYLLENGASTKDVYLGLLSERAPLDPNCVEMLLKAGMKVNWIDGQSPALERICSFAFHQEYQNQLSDTDRESVKKIIDMLAQTGARSSNLLKDAHKSFDPADLDRCHRCSWIVEYLVNKGLEVHCPLPEWFMEQIAEDKEWARNIRTPSPGGLALSAISRDLYNVTTEGQDSLERGKEMLRTLTSEGKWKPEYAEQLLVHFVEGRFNRHAPILDLLKQKKPDIRPDLLAWALCRACKWADENVLEKFCALKVDVQAYNNLPLSQAAFHKREEAIFRVKLLVERGAHIQEVEQQIVPMFRDVMPARAYMLIINETLNPHSDLHFGKILPEEVVNRYQMRKCSRTDLQQRPAFRFLSHCAAVAVLLSKESSRKTNIDTAKKIFKNFVVRASNEFKEKKIADVESRAAQVLRNCRDRIDEISYAFVDAIALPALVRRVGLDEVRLGDNQESSKYDIARFRDSLLRKAKPFFAENISLEEFGKFLNRWEHVHMKHPRTNDHSSWWYPLIDTTELAPGVTIRAIARYDELVKEGEEMGNCFKRGLHATNCLVGHEHILAIRINGASVLDLTVQRVNEEDAGSDSDRGKWKVVYYEGRNQDRNPPPELTKYIDLFQSRLDSGEIQTRAAPFGQTPESEASLSQALSTPLERALGIDFKKEPTEALAFYEHIFVVKPDDWPGKQANIHLPIFSKDTIPEHFEKYVNILRTGEMPYNEEKLDT